MIESIEELLGLEKWQCADIIGYGRNAGKHLHEVPEDYYRYVSKGSNSKELFAKFKTLAIESYRFLNHKHIILDRAESHFYQYHIKDVDKLRAWQINWIRFVKFGLVKFNGGLCLFAEMGTGKTFAVIELLKMLFTIPKFESRVLILVPKTVLLSEVWQKQIMQYFPDLASFDVSVATGSAEQKFLTLRTCRKILVTNYESLSNEKFLKLCQQKFSICICDESDKAKTHKANISRYLHKLAHYMIFRVVLTGTPQTNKETDYWSQVYFADLGRTFGFRYWDFVKKYFEKKVDLKKKQNPNHVKPTIQPALADEFTEKLKSVSFAVDKSFLKLAPKNIQIVQVKLSKETSIIYRKILNEVTLIIDNKHITTPHKMTEIQRLRQITSGFLYMPEDKKTKIISTEKIDKLIQMSMALGSKSVITANFKAEIKFISNELTKRGINNGKIFSETNDSDKKRFISDFNNHDLLYCLILQRQTSAGIDGLQNRCHNMFIFSRDYSYRNEQQSQDRLHRSGQTQTVNYYDFQAVLDTGRATIDQVLLESVQEKNIRISKIFEKIKKLV